LPVIETVNLTKYYGKLLALSNLNLTVEEGDCVGYLGPNGAGKTTTIKLLCNLIRPSKGEAYINGINVRKHPDKALKHVGAIVEVPGFYPYLTAKEHLEFLGRLRGIPLNEIRQRIREVLELVGLGECINRKVGTFSRGMLQRLAIAQALIHDPDILILDEPAIGLDPRGMHEIREIIKMLHRKEKKTIFLSSHLLYEVEQICEKVALLNKGVLLAYDKISNLEKILKHSVVEAALVEPPSGGQLEQIKELEFVQKYDISPDGKTLYIHVLGGEEARYQLLKSLIDLGLKISSFKSSETLEQIYLELVKESA